MTIDITTQDGENTYRYDSASDSDIYRIGCVLYFHDSEKRTEYPIGKFFNEEDASHELSRITAILPKLDLPSRSEHTKVRTAEFVHAICRVLYRRIDNEQITYTQEGIY